MEEVNKEGEKENKRRLEETEVEGKNKERHWR